MANDDFVEVGAGDTWNGTNSDLQIGANITGEYIAHRSNVGPNKSELHTLRTSEGDLGIWGSTVLDGRFEQVNVGDIVRVTYLGLSAKASPGKKPWKLWKVESKPGTGQPSAAPAQEAQLDDAGEIDLKDLGY